MQVLRGKVGWEANLSRLWIGSQELFSVVLVPAPCLSYNLVLY